MRAFRYRHRDLYAQNQIKFSDQKFSKVSARLEEIVFLRTVITSFENRLGPLLGAPVVCMGVRNGAEIDYWTRQLDLGARLRKRTLSRTRVPAEEFYRLPSSGVEISPGVSRPDVWCGDYARLPESWTGKFRLVYSNSLDHAFDLAETVAEWERILRPGGLLVLQTPDDSMDANEHTTIVGISSDDLRAVLPNMTLLYFQCPSMIQGWQNYILRKP